MKDGRHSPSCGTLVSATHGKRSVRPLLTAPSIYFQNRKCSLSSSARREGCRSRAHTLINNHIVKDADDSSSVGVVVGNSQWRHARRRTARGWGSVGPDAVDKCAYPGVVRSDAVPRRTCPVAIVRPVTIRSQNPPVPPDLAEGYPQRVPAAAGFAVATLTVGLMTRRTPLTTATATRPSPSPSSSSPSGPRHDAESRAVV